MAQDIETIPALDMLRDNPQLAHHLGEYSITLQEHNALQAKLDMADRFLELVRDGLPEGWLFVTHTQPQSRPGFGESAHRFKRAPGNTLFRPSQSSGKYEPYGHISTERWDFPFLGDRLALTDEGILAVINNERSVGLSVADRVDVVQNSQETIGNNMRRFGELMVMIKRVGDGQDVVFDCVYHVIHGLRIESITHYEGR